MSYALEIADEAAEDLLALIESLPSSQRADATDAVEVELNRLTSDPLPRAKEHLGRPAHKFTFRTGAITHRWGATYRISEDERSLVITHIYKLPPLVL